jgi:hypothetical protein
MGAITNDILNSKLKFKAMLDTKNNRKFLNIGQRIENPLLFRIKELNIDNMEVMHSHDIDSKNKIMLLRGEHDGFIFWLPVHKTKKFWGWRIGELYTKDTYNWTGSKYLFREFKCYIQCGKAILHYVKFAENLKFSRDLDDKLSDPAYKKDNGLIDGM